MNLENKRWAFFLPNTFTALNMACGFAAILQGFHGDFYKASMFIILGAVFDSVDGRVARLTNTQSSFGEQFDSLSDLITFGVAPAFVFYFRFLVESGRPGMVAAFFFILCGALRLARFNANIILISLNFPDLNFFRFVPVIYLIFYAALMISNIPFPSFKNSEWAKQHKKQVLMVIFLILASVFIFEEVMIPVIITSYVVLTLAYYLTHRKKFEGIFEWKEEPEASDS